MLLSARAYQLAAGSNPRAATPSKSAGEAETPFIRWTPGWKTQRLEFEHACKMLLVHQTGAVKVGEVVRYTLTYEPAADRILPSPSQLFVRIKNTSALPLRAAYLHGPYTLHVAAYPSDYNPNTKFNDTRTRGAPQFEPNLKAGGGWNSRIPVPEDIRVSGSGSGASGTVNDGSPPKTLTWIIEITSQILFSSSASVNFELLVSRDERSLDYNLSAVLGPSQGHGESGQVQDQQQGGGKGPPGRRPAHTKGVYSRAIRLVVDNTESLWNLPPLPRWEEEREKGRKSVDKSRHSVDKERKEPPRKKQKIHLVILTHGLHSNLSADMLYLKESIDATAKDAKESRRKRKEAEREAKGPGAEEEEDDDDEEIMVRGFTGNAVKTENGIQYLGKRMAKYILETTYPDQPYKPIRKSMTQKFANAMGTSKKPDDPGQPTHGGSTIREEDVSEANLPYTFTKISFVGHSLGGLIQLYAIGYIQKHAPKFFDLIEPVNFVALASPFLGLSNENPMYVKFALDFGLVGRTGQDLGLTWRPPALAKSGWSAMGFGGPSKDSEHPDPGAKPLLRILPTGPAHRVLRMFRNRTVYSNVVNDGIVPLRTSCLLFLDWRGLTRVEKARRENGIIGTVANWGWNELTGANSSPNPSSSRLASDDESKDNSDDDKQPGKFETTVPQPAIDETNQDYQEQRASGSAEHHYIHEAQEHDSDNGSHRSRPPPSPSALDGIRNFLGLTSKTTKKDLKMYKRSQTIDMRDEEAANPPKPAKKVDANRGRPLASRGDSVLNNPNSNAPPKTSIFESAGDILNPPIPPQSWIVDPASRARTIFHDRVYHPEDIPPPALKRPKSQTGEQTPTAGVSVHVGAADASTDSSTVKVEEKIARAYHKDLSWRKVLVRLEPDAHNNMIVRRMFANAYGWPVVKHICDTHFGDTYAARTRDEEEPAHDRAKGVEKPVGEHGEHVKGQEKIDPPKRPDSEMREAADELEPLRESTSADPKPGNIQKSATGKSSSFDSYDETYYEDNEEDEENRGLIPRFWSPPPMFGGKGGESSAGSSKRASTTAKSDEDGHPSSQAEIADFLTSEPPMMEGHRGLAPVPIRPSTSESAKSGKVADRATVSPSAASPTSPTGNTADVGLKKSIESMTRPGSKDGISANVASSLGSPKEAPK